METVPPAAVTVVVLAASGLGLLFSAWRWLQVAQVINDPSSDAGNRQSLAHDADVRQKVWDISRAISEGAEAFLAAQYSLLGVFVALFFILILVVVGTGSGEGWASGVFAAVAFAAGAGASVASGYIGMRIAVFTNSRTALQAQVGLGPAFVTAFQGGCVMGFALVSLGLATLYALVCALHLYYTDAYSDSEATRRMYEAVAGYGLGGSTIALFGRVGGGIYTKAADVGADLVGKVEQDIPEDDPRNPAVIADNVGDNVGDVAGMGADLFGSFAEASCAAMAISATSPDLCGWLPMNFPLAMAASGLVAGMATSLAATACGGPRANAQIEPALKRQLVLSTVLETPLAFAVAYAFLPREPFAVSGKAGVAYWHVFLCAACGLWSGLAIGASTEFYTSHARAPVREVAAACEAGAATNIIYGLALGYRSVVVPVVCLCATIYASERLAGVYGVAVAATGILSTMSTGLAIDAYGPITDNAGGIAEMAEMGDDVRDRTDALDAAGNTTAAVGKGFAIGSAALVSLALFGGFVTICREEGRLHSVDILEPLQFTGLLLGAMLPYWFSALTVRSVGAAAYEMVTEVRRQFRENPGILAGTDPPDYRRCVKISTEASLREMLPPGALVLGAPVAVGFLLGAEALAGLLAGVLVSGVQMAVSASNSGAAWDNAKKYIGAGMYANAAGEVRGKGTEEHRAAVIGDTVGDPLKDTSGPSINILVKLTAILSLVFASAIAKHGGVLVRAFE